MDTTAAVGSGSGASLLDLAMTADRALGRVKALAEMTEDLLQSMGCGGDVLSAKVVQEAVMEVESLAVQLRAAYARSHSGGYVRWLPVEAAEAETVAVALHGNSSNFQRELQHQVDAMRSRMEREMMQMVHGSPSVALAPMAPVYGLAAAQRQYNQELKTAITVAKDAYAKDRDGQRELDEKAKLVFSYWAAVTDRPRSMFDDRRRQRIVSRLKENGGDVDELLYAIDGAMKDPWLSGKDPKTNGKKYDGVETILRDRAQVERLAETQRGYQRSEPHPLHEIQRRQAEATAGGRRAV